MSCFVSLGPVYNLPGYMGQGHLQAAREQHWLLVGDKYRKILSNVIQN